MKIIKFTTIFTLIVIFVLPIVMATQIKMIPGNVQPGYDGAKRVSIYSDKVFSQEFISKDDNLTAIGTSIKNPNLKNKSDVILKLYDEDKNLLRQTVINGFNLEDGSFVKLVFDPIQDSKDKKYHFEITSSQASVDEVIELFITKESETAINYTYENETFKGGAPIVLYYKSEGALRNIIEVYSNAFGLK